VYKSVKNCRICGGENLVRILDLGTQMLTGVFPKTKDAKGNVFDCKTDYHREKEAPDKLIQNDIINKHKGIAKRINDLLSKKSFEVLTADLDAYDIDLSTCLEFKLKSNGELTTIFLEHTILTNPITKTHKILHNDK